MTKRKLASLGLLLAGLALEGCRTVDFDAPKEESWALAVEETTDTDLGRLVAGLHPDQPGEGGFYVLSDGIEALAARVVIAERAERTIDAQYYLINDDITGYLFIQVLMDAADRGVRVRLLLDDIQTQGYDLGLWAMDAHPNIEIRIFNPFAYRTWRFMDGLTGFRRVNRRMHNKSFTGDNQVTVIGGRNIGAEYFGASEDVNFGDMDVLCFGPPVDEVSHMFDTYWNDSAAVPVTAFVDPPEDQEGEQAAFRGRIAAGLEGIEESPYGQVLIETILESTTNEQEEDGELVWCPYELVYDPPGKSRTERPKDQETILTPFRRIFAGASEEFLLISPYFVPQRSGVRGFQDAVERGIHCRVITNSLAANNHAAVHTGYMPARVPLLEMGVELYEVRPDITIESAERGGAESSRATLHTKAFVVDRRHVFIGSFNWDPRSAHINTEMGIVLDSRELAEAFVESVDEKIPTHAYEVVLDDAGRMQWITWDGFEKKVYTTEPAPYWTRFKVSWMGFVPIQSQL